MAILVREKFTWRSRCDADLAVGVRTNAYPKPYRPGMVAG